VARLLKFAAQYRIESPSTVEGTGTRPDYLVNRVLAKNEGPLARKSRNGFRVSGGGVGAYGQLTRGSSGLSPN